MEKRLHVFTNSELVIGHVDCDLYKELCSRERATKVPIIKLYTVLDDTTQLEFIYDQSDVDLVSLQNFLWKKLPDLIIEGYNYNNNVNNNNHHENGGEIEFNNNNNDNIVNSFTLIKMDNSIRWILKGFYELTDQDFSVFLAAKGKFQRATHCLSNLFFLFKGENLVYFYTPWCKACQKLEPVWELVIKSMRTTRLSRIDCSRNIYACRFYQINDYPTLLWISNGLVKQRYKNLNQFDMFKIKYLIHLIETPQLHSKLQLNLNIEDFRQFINSGYYFVHFTVPWSKHCSKMESEWLDLLDAAFDMNVNIAKVDCSVNEKLCDLEQVRIIAILYYIIIL